MTKETPTWLQAGVYPARLDRAFIEEVMRRQARVFRGLAVTQRAAGGANFSVDVSIGVCAVVGTSQANQGMYFCKSTAIENVVVPATPGAPRTDSVYAVVNDPNAGGAAGSNWNIAAIAGTTLPANSLLLATIARTVSEPSILNAAITDMRPLGEWPWTVSTVAPTALQKGVPGDLWIVCP